MNTVIRICLLGALAVLVGCATLEKHENSSRLVTQYAVLKYIEEAQEGERSERAGRIRTVAAHIKTLASGETSLEILQTAIADQIDKAGLSPADRLLADLMVQIIVDEARNRIGVGVLAPGQLVQVIEVLDWVIAATELQP